MNGINPGDYVVKGKTTFLNGDSMKKVSKILLSVLTVSIGLALASMGPGMAGEKQPKDQVSQHLKTFDELDYDVFSNQKWDRLSESHADDIVVTWPDGHQTKGIKKHLEDLKAMFVYAPDTQIKEHPIKFGSGDWTCATGIMTGTFTKPMPTPDGKFIQPTGKSFKLPMVTIGQWKNGKMIAETLSWDNQTFMQQIGLAK